MARWCGAITVLWLAVVSHAQDATAAPTAPVSSGSATTVNASSSPSTAVPTASAFPTGSAFPTTGPTATAFPTTGPTATWFPTLTPIPTTTAFPSSAPCNICTDSVVSRGTDLLVLPNRTVSCTELNVAGQTGLLSTSNCRFIQELIDASRTTSNLCGCAAAAAGTEFPPCNICPSGYDVTMDTGVLVPPLVSINASTTSQARSVTDPSLECNFVQLGGRTGLWSVDACRDWQVAADVNGTNPCGCRPMSEIDNSPTQSQSNDDSDNSTTCSICPEASWRVNDATSNQTVDVPRDFLDLLPSLGVNETFFTCASIQESGVLGLWDPIVCAYLQMQSRVCVCEAVPTASPVTLAPGPASVPTARESSGATRVDLRFGLAWLLGMVLLRM